MLTSGWPPFYAARRLGLGGREFSVWKIRTMRRNADESRLLWAETHPELAIEYALNLKVRNDPRVTHLGRLLRRASLDELPQLWNVVRGDMSLVGPRPYFLEELIESPNVLGAICSVKPGLTGPWQVGGRNRLLPAARMDLDTGYAADVTISSDIRYLLGTGGLPAADGRYLAILPRTTRLGRKTPRCTPHRSVRGDTAATGV